MTQYNWVKAGNLDPTYYLETKHVGTITVYQDWYADRCNYTNWYMDCPIFDIWSLILEAKDLIEAKEFAIGIVINKILDMKEEMVEIVHLTQTGNLK